MGEIVVASQANVRRCAVGGHDFDTTNGGYVVRTRTEEDGSKTESYTCNPCDKAQRVKAYEDTGVVDSSTWTEAVILTERAKYAREKVEASGADRPRVVLTWADQLMAEMEAVERIGRAWQRMVWFGGRTPEADDERTEPYPGLERDTRRYKQKPDGYGPLLEVLPKGSLQAFVLAARFKGYCATVDGLEYLSYTMCGRSIFQIGDLETKAFVSYIMEEDSPQLRGGVRSIGASAKDAVRMFQRAIDDWTAGKIGLRQGDGVGFGF